MKFDYLYGNNRQIYFFDCQLTEDVLSVEFSRFGTKTKPGIYALGDNALKPSIDVEIPENILQERRFLLTERIFLKVTKVYD